MLARAGRKRTRGKARVTRYICFTARSPPHARERAPAPKDSMKSVSLDDRYTLERGQIFLSGVQAIVRLALDQRRHDARAGLPTGGFVSGYRGPPLRRVDFAFWQAEALLKANNIKFAPGLNEE